MAAFNSADREADLRTLRLSNPVLSVEVLDRFLEYQEALAGLLRKSRTAESQASAHLEALGRSGLSAGEVGQVASLCAQFCAKRQVAATLAERRARLVERIGAAESRGVSAEPNDRAALARIDAAREALEDLGPLERRYGKAQIAELVAREPRLLSLHRLILAADPPIRPLK